MAAGSRSAAEERHDEEALELSLRLRTGGSSGSSAAAEEAAAAAMRRSMTIFYNGRVCAVDVTELQARTIITMANHQILTEQRQRIDSDRHLQDSSSSSSSTNSAAAHCRGRQDTKPPPAPQRSAPLLAPPPGLTGAVAAPVISQAAAAGLSMKRSLQQFLQKRKTRIATAGSPYAGGRPAARHSAMHS